MSYTLTLLTTAADCDALLDMADGTLKDLQRRAANLDYQRENSTDTAAAIQVELTSVQAEIDALNKVLPDLPEGTVKKRNAVGLRRATNRLAELTDRQAARGPVSMLSRELDLAQADVQITEVKAFIAAVTARKAAL